MKKREIVGILNDVRSLHNVGSIFRTADGAGFLKLFLCGITPTPLDRMGNVRQEFAKTALHAEKMVSWVYQKSVTRVITKLKKEGFVVYAVEQSANSIPYTKLLKSQKKIAIIMGNEVDGIKKSILEKCDGILEIPMHGGKESLNVSVAFGIVAYELQR